MARARARAGAKARVSHRLVDELDDAADDRVIPALQRGQRDDRVELHDRRHDVERGAPPVAHSSAHPGGVYTGLTMASKGAPLARVALWAEPASSQLHADRDWPVQS